jgi:hypothetical protein
VSDTYQESNFEQFVKRFDREQGKAFGFADLPPGWQASIKTAFLETVEEIERDLY